MEQSKFVSKKIAFASKYPVNLTIYAPHVVQRMLERLGRDYRNKENECCDFFEVLLHDERLAVIYERVPFLGTAVLFIEEFCLFVFMQIGTKMDKNEVKVHTVILGNEKYQKVLVEREDFCYVLPRTGSLRFGKEKKYFAYKQM